MLNPFVAISYFPKKHELFEQETEKIELHLDEWNINTPFDEAHKPGFTASEIRLLADKISDKLIKIVEQQLTTSPKP